MCYLNSICKIDSTINRSYILKGKHYHNCKKGNSCSVEDIPDISTYSILEPDGTWHDDMHNVFEFWKIVNKYKDGKHICVVVDRHI